MIHGPHRAVTAVVALALVFAPVAVVSAAPSPDYPSWDEVEKARHDEAAAAREAARIEAALAELEADAVRLGRDAQLRAEESFIAQHEFEKAAARSDTLARSSAEAEQRASSSARVAAQALVELSRAGGGDPTLALLGVGRREADGLLRALAAAARLGETSQALLDRAVADRNSAGALAAEAALAEGLRADAAELAARSAEAAEQAVEAAAARAVVRQADLDRLYAQLATLRGTTADLERAYWEGRDAAERPEVPADPGSGGGGSGDGGSEGSSGSGGGGSGGSGDSDGSTEPDPKPSATPSPSPSAPETVPPDSIRVATAIAYAKDQLGEPYVYAGAGPSGWDCSGLTMQSYAAAGVVIGGHGSTSQYDYLKSKGRLVPVGQRQAGDLLFYSAGGSTSATKYHVTMYLGGGKMIEAPYPGQVVRIVAVRTADLVSLAGRPTT